MAADRIDGFLEADEVDASVAWQRIFEAI